ncbi:MAG: hypothetical protein ACOCT9_01915 [archaeon]
MKDGIIDGAYYLFNLKKRCGSCGIDSSPMWRKGWYDDRLKKHVNLCNSDGLRFSKGQYCPVCHYVYLKKEIDPLFWLGCVVCSNYTHKMCDQEADSRNYVCIHCKNKTKHQWGEMM